MYLPDKKKTEAMLPEELLKTKKVKRYYSKKLGKYQNRISYCPHLQTLPIPGGESHKKQVQ